MIFILLFILMILGVIFFINRRLYYSMCVFIFFITQGFQIVPEKELNGYPLAKFLDFALAYLMCVLFYIYFKHKYIFTTKDNLSKLILVLISYYIFELFITVASGQETFGSSMKVFRYNLLLLAYFPLKLYDKKSLEKLLDFIVKLTVLTTIVYILQIVFSTKILQGSIDNDTSYIAGSISRYRNIPIFFYFVMFYIFYITNSRYKIPLFVLFVAGLVIPMNRGPILATCIVVIGFSIIENDYSNLIKYMLFSILVSIMAWPFISNRFAKEDIGGDIVKAVNLSNFSSFDESGDGNFSFRVALLLERIDYLEKHSSYTLTGIGLRHEDSPKTQRDFNFFIGANKKDVDGKTLIKQQIETTDLVWATMILRYGLIGLILNVSLIGYIIKYFFVNKKFFISKVMSVLLLMFLINSFATDILVRPSTFFIVFLVYNLTRRIKLNLINSSKV